jgi:hypothetical protein
VLHDVTVKVPMHFAVAANVMPAAFEHQGKAPVITSAGAVVVSSRMLHKTEEGQKGGRREAEPAAASEWDGGRKKGPVDSAPPNMELKYTRVHRGHAGKGRIAAAIGWLVHRREAAVVRWVLAERDERRRYEAAAARRVAQLRVPLLV